MSICRGGLVFFFLCGGVGCSVCWCVGVLWLRAWGRSSSAVGSGVERSGGRRAALWLVRCGLSSCCTLAVGARARAS